MFAKKLLRALPLLLILLLTACVCRNNREGYVKVSRLPAEALLYWRAEGARDATLIAVSDTLYSSPVESGWAMLPEEDAAIFKRAVKEGIFSRIFWIAPYDISDWSDETVKEYLLSHELDAGSVKREDFGFSFLFGRARVFLTSIENLPKAPLDDKRNFVYVDGSYFARLYLGVLLSNINPETFETPSEVVETILPYEPESWVLQSRFEANESAMTLAGEAGSALAEHYIQTGDEHFCDAIHDAIVLNFGGNAEKAENILGGLPSEEEVFLAQLVIAIKEKDASDAADALHKLVETDPYSAVLRERIGEYFFHSATTAESVEFYNETEDIAFDEESAELSGVSVKITAPQNIDLMPNVVLITIDTLRADALGCYGDEKAKTPSIDAFSERAVVFDAAFAPIAQTTPSHAAMLTGLHPLTLGLHDNGVPLDGSYQTLATILSEVGYETAAFVSGFPLADSVSGLARGFGIYDDEMTEPLLRDNPYFVERKAEETAKRAINWLKNKKRDRPIFLWVHYYDPHYPYNPPDAFKNIYEEPPVSSELKKYFLGAEGDEHGAELNKERNLYFGEVSYVDREFGKLLKALAEEKILDDAVVVFVADHGEALGEHGYYFDHGNTIFPAETRVPLMFFAKNLSHQRFTETVSIVSIAPTILDIVGVKIKTDFDAVSLKSWLEGEVRADEPAFLYTGSVHQRNENCLVQAGIAQGRWFYAADIEKGTKWLSLLSEDPYCLENLRGVRKDAEIVSLERKLEAWRADAAKKMHTRIPKKLTEEEKEKLRSLGYL